MGEVLSGVATVLDWYAVTSAVAYAALRVQGDKGDVGVLGARSDCVRCAARGARCSVLRAAVSPAFRRTPEDACVSTGRSVLAGPGKTTKNPPASGAASVLRRGPTGRLFWRFTGRMSRQTLGAMAVPISGRSGG